MKINENLWKSMKIYENRWKKQWKTMKIYENLKKSIKSYKNRWKSIPDPEIPKPIKHLLAVPGFEAVPNTKGWQRNVMESGAPLFFENHKIRMKIMEINKNQWKSMRIYEQLMKIKENLWKSMKIYESKWKSSKINENLRKSIKSKESLRKIDEN